MRFEGEKLEGKKAVVLGGSSGIGFETARELLAAGASVVIASRSEARLAVAAASLGGAVASRILDGRVAADLEAFFADIGPFDHLILTMNAGGGVAPFGDLHEARFRMVFDNKFWPYVNAIRLCLDTLAPDGSITIIGGNAARKAIRGMAGIAATNGALHAMVGPLALELAPRRVNAVAPGLIDTPYWDNVNEERRRELFAFAAAQAPVGRVGTAQDIARAVLYLIGSTFTTGTILDCDGGVHIT